VAFQEYDAKNAPEYEGCLFWEEKRNREGGNNFEWKNQKNDKDLKKVSWNRMEEMKFSQHNLTKVQYIGRSKTCNIFKSEEFAELIYLIGITMFYIVQWAAIHSKYCRARFSKSI
jgi:hypothetical protein